jgi:hypothetical protein
MASSLVVDQPCALEYSRVYPGYHPQNEGKYIGDFPSGKCNLEKRKRTCSMEITSFARGDFLWRRKPLY